MTEKLIIRRDVLKVSAIAAAATVSSAHTVLAAGPVKAEFVMNDRIVFTYFFTWYNWPNQTLATQEHIVHPDGFDYLSVHPSPQTVGYSNNSNYRARRAPNVSGAPLLSYSSSKWFEAELASMATNAIDICAVDFWAFPDPNSPPRSRYAVDNINNAMNNMDSVGVRYPAVCLFLESKPMGNGKGGGGQITDLRTEDGAQKLFRAVDDFYSRVAKNRWARIDGDALVILYDADFPGFIAAPFGVNRCKELFQQKYGVGLTFFGNNEWRAESRAGASINYGCKWGAARRKTRLVEGPDLMEISPGTNFLGNTYDAPRSTAAYRLAWESARRQPRNWIAIETWNEWHEATGVANTREDGDEFLRVTQSQARRFKNRE